MRTKVSESKQVLVYHIFDSFVPSVKGHKVNSNSEHYRSHCIIIS